MQVKDLMTTDVFTVKQEAKVSEVADMLHSRGLTGIPVVTDDLTVVGLITEKELFSADSKLYFPGYLKILQETKYVVGDHKDLPYGAEQLTRITAKDIMNQNVFFASSDMPAEKLAEAFIRENQSPIPVTDANHKLLGIVSRSDLIKLLIPVGMTTFSKIAPAEEKEVIPRPVDTELKYIHENQDSIVTRIFRLKVNLWLAIIGALIIGALIWWTLALR
jgi:CBS domain-containing protein